jgi:hypothetical protein
VFGWLFFRRQDASLLSGFRPQMAWLLLIAFGKLNSLQLFRGVVLLFLSFVSVLLVVDGVVLLLLSFVHAVSFSSVSLLSPVGGLMDVSVLRCPILLCSGFSLMIGGDSRTLLKSLPT